MSGVSALGVSALMSTPTSAKDSADSALIFPPASRRLHAGRGDVREAACHPRHQ
jgi:hypothetical protein